MRGPNHVINKIDHLIPFKVLLRYLTNFYISKELIFIYFVCKSTLQEERVAWVRAKPFKHHYKLYNRLSQIDLFNWIN